MTLDVKRYPILVVDDEQDNLDAFRFNFRKTFDILTATSGPEALSILEKHSQGVLELAARVNQLEREADRVHQDAIVSLFDEERDPIAVIKWKEIFDFLEAATDRCEDVCNLLEGVVVKHG